MDPLLYLNGKLYVLTRNGQDTVLAAQGYAVPQLDPRGIYGYGDRYFRAGWRQWGGAVQDDLAAIVRWAVVQAHTPLDMIGGRASQPCPPARVATL